LQKFYNQLVRLAALALAIIWCLPGMALAAPKEKAPTSLVPVKITVLATAGVNGHLMNWNYDLSRKTDFGLVRISSLVKKERQSNPNVLLVDGGNMLSGSSLTSYFASDPLPLPPPMTAMYNYLGYDAVTLGEGELAYGQAYLSKSLAIAKFPMLSANAHFSDKNNTLPAIKPYTIKEFEVSQGKKKEKLRIAIIGGSTISPYANQVDGLTFTDRDKAINDIVKKIQKKVDAVIIVKNDGLTVNGITAVEPGKLGSSISKTEITFVKAKKQWVAVQSETSSLLTLTAAPDKGMEDAIWPYHDATLQYLTKRPQQ
jgi:2',3'-cyclic-nucleotide 2'-phosphodiesterase (5'-nucleotidase family)